MIDLHCHMLPGVDDGAADDATALAMARMFVADGVTTVACTPHILPGLYHNTGPQIRDAVQRLDLKFREQGIDLTLVSGADAHICANFVHGLRTGAILSLAGTRYVLVEPPHHTAPQRMDQFFFDLLVAGYVPILTHPERLTWINQQYGLIQRLAASGVWMQITAGSLTGAFGKNAQYWAERMLDEGVVHILATDAHETHRRKPDLSRGRDAAAKRVGDEEAWHLVLTRPRGVLANEAPNTIIAPAGVDPVSRIGNAERARVAADRAGDPHVHAGRPGRRRNSERGWTDRLWRLFE